MSKISFYVTGHGHGHARRSAELIKALIDLRPDLQIFVRTNAPSEIFDKIPRTLTLRPPPGFDPGAIEDDILTINPEETVRAMKDSIRGAEHFVQREAASARGQKISLIITDISFLAAEVAAAAGLPGVGFSNFCWDWIIEPFVKEDPEGPELLHRIHRCYSKLNLFLKLPFSHPIELPAKIVNTPLIAQRSTRSKTDVLEACGIAADDSRPRVVVGLRSGVAAAALRRAASELSEVLFFSPGADEKDSPENIQSLSNVPHVSFADLLSVSDAVVAKLGFGILADCIVARTRLLYPPRLNFREDEITEQTAGPLLPLRAISREDFVEGRWSHALRELLSMKVPEKAPPSDGANFCAKRILEMME